MHEEPGDSELERQLGRAIARFDPVPDAAIEAAADSLTWRTIDADLAELEFDSLNDMDDAALVRGSAEQVALTFRSRDLTIEIEVTSVRAGCRLVGQLIPPQSATVEIRHAADSIVVEADDLGRFAAESVRPGPISVRCRRGDAVVVTEWFTA